MARFDSKPRNGGSVTREPMSGADAAWLHMDSPTNLMVVNAVLWFDEPLDWERAGQQHSLALGGRECAAVGDSASYPW